MYVVSNTVTEYMYNMAYVLNIHCVDSGVHGCMYVQNYVHISTFGKYM